MTGNIDPLEVAAADLEKKYHQAKHLARDWIQTHATLGLLKLSITGLIAAALAVAGLPWLAGAAAAIVIVALIVFNYYEMQIIKSQDREHRWDLISRIRLEQQKLRAEIAADRAILVLLDDPKDRHMKMRARPQELNQVVAYLRSKRIQEHAASQGVRSNARPAVPPDVTAVRNRVKVGDAKLAELEAQAQSLAVPENLADRLAAEDAARDRHQVQTDAATADRAARERRRAGHVASPPCQGAQLRVQIPPFGNRKVEQVPAPLTPEQIARGERLPAPDVTDQDQNQAA